MCMFFRTFYVQYMCR